MVIMIGAPIIIDRVISLVMIGMTMVMIGTPITNDQKVTSLTMVMISIPITMN
ncbi:hypothetical protein [uncultured Ruegeria sp.]|uniref:hypothetical protein n=1 Tax=uncultured Ruegeria sp. TaxID=259304 RepID=UPI00262FDE0C|nr:hypothetical protein [uncultured Ruegeria sp.]